MEPKFAHGDRVIIANENVAAQLSIASRTGAVVQSDPDHGEEGTYQVMFDGEDLPQWITGSALARTT